MTSEQDTKEGRIRRVIDDEISQPQTGIVTKVWEHTQTDDRWNFHLDVKINPNRHFRKVPFAVPFADLSTPPRSADHPDGPDLVLVQFLEDSETERPLATHILYNNEDRPPEVSGGSEHIIRLTRGELYFEAHPDGDWMRIAKKPDDKSNPNVRIELDDQGNIKLGSDSLNVRVTQGGTVKLGDPDGTFKRVAREGDPTSDGASISGGSDDVEAS